VVIAVVAGAVGAALVNRGVAVFHDGLRAALPERMAGRMARREFLSLSSGMSLGLLLGFGLPFSLATGILLNHLLWLGTDLIGARFAAPWDGARGRGLASLAGAALAGGLYGGLLLAGLDGFGRLAEQAPVGLATAREVLLAPIVAILTAFPAVAAAYQYGVWSGAILLLLTVVARLAVGLWALPQPDLWALGAGLAGFLVVAVRAGRGQTPAGNLVPLRGEAQARVRRHLPAIALLGAVYGLACNQALMMEGPQSLVALADGQRGLALLLSAVRGLCFTPAKAMSALAGGVFAMDGYGLVATAGLAAPNALSAALAGAAVMSVEALSVGAVARLVGRFPALLAAIDGLRTGLARTLEVGALVGGLAAAQQVSPGLGLAAAAGLYLLNEAAGTPVVRAAAGPAAALVVWAGANLVAVFMG